MAARKKVGSWTENRTQQPVSVSLENNKPAKCSAHQQSSAQKPNDESKWRRFRNGITHEAKWKAAAVAKYPQRLKLHPHTRSMAFMLNHCSEKWEQNHHNFLCYVSCRFFLTLMCRRLLFLLSSVRLPLNWFGVCVCVCVFIWSLPLLWLLLFVFPVHLSDNSSRSIWDGTRMLSIHIQRHRDSSSFIYLIWFICYSLSLSVSSLDWIFESIIFDWVEPCRMSITLGKIVINFCIRFLHISNNNGRLLYTGQSN